MKGHKHNIFVICLILFSQFTCVAQAKYEGLSGQLLFDAVRESCAPKSYISLNEVWTAFRTTDNAGNNTIINRFSADKYCFIEQDASPEGLNVANILPKAWWADGYGENMDLDLHNLLPAPIEVQNLKRDYPLGRIDESTFDNGFWAVGLMQFGDDYINVYAPPKEYEGDFARAVFYILTVYPSARFSGFGVNFCLKATFPILQPWSKRQLLAWANSDPVDDNERARNDAIFNIQGNRNHFIDFPELIDYIWGEKASLPYEPSKEEIQPTPLRATYHLTEDVIDLFSPYIPQDATWTIDGKDATKNSYSPEELGIGLHNITYRTASVFGKIIIEIVQ